jgi:hypothetical protein
MSFAGYTQRRHNNEKTKSKNAAPLISQRVN